jgi:hypothetical protein
LSDQKCQTRKGWVYGPITNKKIAYTHFDTTRNLKDTLLIHQWTRRLHRIVTYVDEYGAENQPENGALAEEGGNLQSDGQYSEQQSIRKSRNCKLGKGADRITNGTGSGLEAETKDLRIRKENIDLNNALVLQNIEFQTLVRYASLLDTGHLHGILDQSLCLRRTLLFMLSALRSLAF